MDPKFGKIKRANVIRDENSLKRNLNMFVLSEDSDGNLSQANTTLKQNLKTWLDRYKMINDTIDILDGKIINFGIRYEIIADLNSNRFDLLDKCNQKLLDKFLNIKFSLGESIYISDALRLLNEVPGVTDTIKVEFYNIFGGAYSNYVYDIDSNISFDGRYLNIPQDAAAEILFPSTDIVGVVK